MKKDKVIKVKRTVTRKDLVKIFPYHMPHTLTEDELEAIEDKKTSEERLAIIYSRVFNSDILFSNKRHNQLKRIAKEYK